MGLYLHLWPQKLVRALESNPARKSVMHLLQLAVKAAIDTFCWTSCTSTANTSLYRSAMNATDSISEDPTEWAHRIHACLLRCPTLAPDPDGMMSHVLKFQLPPECAELMNRFRTRPATSLAWRSAILELQDFVKARPAPSDRVRAPRRGIGCAVSIESKIVS